MTIKQFSAIAYLGYMCCVKGQSYRTMMNFQLVFTSSYTIKYLRI